MAELTIHGSSVDNVFELLGSHENALTLAVGWALHQSPALLRKLISEIFGKTISAEKANIRLQGYQPDYGYTDIEIDVPGEACAIIEAKRGWNLPGPKQLSKYACRENFEEAPQKRLVILSECLPEYVKQNVHVKPRLRRLIRPLRWQWFIAAAYNLAARTGNKEKGVLRDMASYLKDNTTARDLWNNKVYVVSIANRKLDGCEISWIDVVEKKHRYFHPIGLRGWPANPPTYIGFRYHGKLQSIHFIESYKTVNRLDNDIPEITWDKLDGPHFLYRLGKAIRPNHEVRTGKLYANGRCRCAIDLLLTGKTISEARELTEKRGLRED